LEMRRAIAGSVVCLSTKRVCRRARQARRLIACYSELSKISVPRQLRLPLPHLLLDAFTAFGQFLALD